jgi:hypothetical protein
LTANVVVTAIQEASLQMQIDATRQLIDQLQHGCKSCNINFQGLCQPAGSGRAGIAARASRRHAAAAAQAAGPAARPAGGSGRPVSEQAPADKFELSSLQLPEELPVSLPSQLVAQRPDVLQAEANLHAASARSASPSPTGCRTSR